MNGWLMRALWITGGVLLEVVFIAARKKNPMVPRMTLKP